MLEEHGFLRAAQSLDHLRLVAVHALEDVIVGIDLSLDVLQTHRQKGKSLTLTEILQGKSSFGDGSGTAETQTRIKITPKSDVTVFPAVTADYS